MKKIKGKKKIKIVRYARASGRSARRLTRKKIVQWLNDNVKGHPFITGVLFFLWIMQVIDLLFSTRTAANSAKAMLRVDVVLLLVWLILVALSNALKDTQKTRWFFKKKLVFFMMFLFYPLGLIFLWSGSKFKTVTKTVLTVLFGVFFLWNVVHQEKNKDLETKGTFESIIRTVSSNKKKVHLPLYNESALLDLKIIHLEGRNKPKLAISEISSRFSPSVVTITTKDKEGKDLGMGSGFVISKDGYIATNYHVVESAYQAQVKMGDKVYEPVFLVRASSQRDMAILKIIADGLSPLVIGRSDKLISGQVIVALGNPLGLERSVSSGIVSSIRTGKDIKLIQMTVPVSLGSSGGPVFNEYGEVIGITTLGSFFFAQNVNFAVPIDYLDTIIKQK